MSVKKFSKAFLPTAIISCAIIVFGVVGFFVRGINLGIDFAPGFIEEVRIAPAAMEITYNGSATVSLETSNVALSLVISGTGAENETRTFSYGQNPTVSAMAESLNSVEGIVANVLANENADTYGIYTNSAVTSRLSSDSPFLLYVPNLENLVDVDDVRETLSGMNVNIKELGTENSRSFQIRTVIKDDTSSGAELQSEITNALQEKFGANNVAIVKTDFVASQFSTSLIGKSVLLALLTVLLIWLYATIRFHWDFALGAIIALLHDCLIMFTFIFWTQIEFSTTTLAAVLTIFGYSINATVVILDRVRDNVKLIDTKNFNDILDASISQTLSRSIITTVTTLFAAIALMIFTTGSIKDFAIVLTVGLISGCYSSIFISSGFISCTRKHWSPSDPNHVKPRKVFAVAQN